MTEEQVRRLVAGVQNGEEEAGQGLVELLKPLVTAFAARLAPPAEREDLFQVGVIGLLKAAARFDLKSSTRFTTFAVSWIQGEIKQYRRSHLGPIKISRQLRRQWIRLAKGGHLSHHLGRAGLPERPRPAIHRRDRADYGGGLAGSPPFG